MFCVTNAWRFFPPVFRSGRMKCQADMTLNVNCHAMLWTEKLIVTNIKILATNQNMIKKSQKTRWFDQDHDI